MLSKMLSKEKSEEGITTVDLPVGELTGLLGFYPLGEGMEKVQVPIVAIYNVRQLAMYIAEYLNKRSNNNR